MANAAVRDSTIATSAFSPYTCPKPSVQDGEPMFAVQWSDGSSGSMTAPAGWTQTGPTINSGPRVKIWRKVATSADTMPGTYTFGQGSGADGGVIICSIRDSDPSVNFRLATLGDASYIWGATTPGVTPAAARHLEIRFVLANLLEPVTFRPPAGYTMREQGYSPFLLAGAMAARHITSSANSGAKDFDAGPEEEFLVLEAVGVTISVPSAPTTTPTIPTLPPAVAPGRGDSLYQYRAFRLRTGEYLGHLEDLTGVSFDIKISRRGQINPGTFQGRIPINSEAAGDLAAAIVGRSAADIALGTGVIAVDIHRDGVHYGRYWMTGGRISQQRRDIPWLEIHGLTLDAYPGYVELREDLDELSGDQVDLARQLWASLLGQTGADIPIALQEGDSGVNKTRVYTADQQTTYGQLLAELTADLDGFEHFITPAGLWAWGMPLGDPDAPHYFSQAPEGGDILDWGFEFVLSGTSWRARGDSDNSDASTSSVPIIGAAYDATDHLAAGALRIDRTLDRPGVTSTGRLNAYAQAAAATRSGAPWVSSVTVLLGAEPSIRPDLLGDSVTIAMTNQFFRAAGSGPGYHARHRVIGMRITPTGREQGKDEAELYLDSPETEA